jgi:hypothetical protein
VFLFCVAEGERELRLGNSSKAALLLETAQLLEQDIPADYKKVLVLFKKISTSMLSQARDS